MQSEKNKRVLLGMSGGIDSSVAAILLREQGYEVYGITIRTWDSISESCMSKEKGCCTVESIFEAKKLAEDLGIEHTIVDSRKQFEEVVISNFVNEYMNARTPNPCVVCNPEIKWKIMLEKADELNCYYVATGHYAKLKNENGRYFISKGNDESKDQSYFLWDLPQEYLCRTIFPLAELSKTQAREIAASRGYVKLSTKRESQEICFITDDDYRAFLKDSVSDFNLKVQEGNFVNSENKILGKHKGYPFYTIGQRKGLEVAAGYPLYVTNINPDTNTITLGKREELMKVQMRVRNYRLMKYEDINDEIEASVKIRFRNAGYNARITKSGDELEVLFYEDVSAITPGQSAVFYDGNDVIGGGIIV